jgi:hypothetical protein
MACRRVAASALRVSAVTRQPVRTSSGTKWRPIAPLPPAMKTFIAAGYACVE